MQKGENKNIGEEKYISFFFPLLLAQLRYKKNSSQRLENRQAYSFDTPEK